MRTCVCSKCACSKCARSNSAGGDGQQSRRPSRFQQFAHASTCVVNVHVARLEFKQFAHMSTLLSVVRAQCACGL